MQNVNAQNKNSNEKKQALFIYNFFKYVEWPNISQLKAFNVGVIGDDKNLVYDELIKISKTEKAQGLPIKIKQLSNLNNLDNIQLLFFDKDASLKFDKIYSEIGDKNILLVSKGYPYGKSMINFVMDGNIVQYELSEPKCEAAGLKVKKILTLVAVKSEKEWNAIINKYENLANTDQETVEISTKELNKLVKEQKRLLNEIGDNTKKLEVQKDKLKKQETDISTKETEIANAKKEIANAKKEIANAKKEVEKQKKLVNKQLQRIAIQKEKIASQQTNLSSLNSNVSKKQAELTYQQKELEKEALNLIAIQVEYKTIEKALAEKEILVNEQGEKIDAQGNEIITKTSKIEEQKSIIWLSAIFLVIVTFLGGLAYRSYRLKNKANILISKQKEKIEGQHEVLEEQHREITDSINYAKRIQDAILPPLKLVRGYMPDSFILYQPKDIIAGDFYWMEGINKLIIFAAADCTGHGVPGAMVSVVCHNAMNRAVREFKLVEPDEILNKTREIVLETFEKSDEDVRDGMDIALCTINTESNKLSFAGANNGLYFIRNGEINQIKPDKQPIGKFDDAKPFTKHEIQLEKGDVLYTFSDGYPDQFGGPKGKKFMYKPFRELLLSIHQKSMDDQHNILMDTFENWRGSMEQIDDVCIIGVRI
jgi:serine phosphatase RsbU (regulator of sigma subunit)